MNSKIKELDIDDIPYVISKKMINQDLETFESQIEIEHQERVRKDNIKHKLMDIRGENIYIDFCVWCNCQGDTNYKLRRSAKAFANWLKNKKIVLTKYQRQCIATKYFGWEFYWNEKENKWESRKNGK